VESSIYVRKETENSQCHESLDDIKKKKENIRSSTNMNNNNHPSIDSPVLEKEYPQMLQHISFALTPEHSFREFGRLGLSYVA